MSAKAIAKQRTAMTMPSSSTISVAPARRGSWRGRTELVDAVAVVERPGSVGQQPIEQDDAPRGDAAAQIGEPGRHREQRFGLGADGEAVERRCARKVAGTGVADERAHRVRQVEPVLRRYELLDPPGEPQGRAVAPREIVVGCRARGAKRAARLQATETAPQGERRMRRVPAPRRVDDPVMGADDRSRASEDGLKASDARLRKVSKCRVRVHQPVPGTRLGEDDSAAASDRARACAGAGRRRHGGSSTRAGRRGPRPPAGSPCAS